MSVDSPISNNLCTNHNSSAAKPLLFSLLACNSRRNSKMYRYGFPCHRNSGVKFRTFQVSNGRRERYIPVAQTWPRPPSVWFVSNKNATKAKIKQKSPKKCKLALIHHIIINSWTWIVEYGCIKKDKYIALYSQMEAGFLQIFTNVHHSEQQFR